jgi:hypothetical protein
MEGKANALTCNAASQLRVDCTSLESILAPRVTTLGPSQRPAFVRSTTTLNPAPYIFNPRHQHASEAQGRRRRRHCAQEGQDGWPAPQKSEATRLGQGALTRHNTPSPPPLPA